MFTVPFHFPFHRSILYSSPAIRDSSDLGYIKHLVSYQGSSLMGKSLGMRLQNIHFWMTYRIIQIQMVQIIQIWMINFHLEKTGMYLIHIWRFARITYHPFLESDRTCPSASLGTGWSSEEVWWVKQCVCAACSTCCYGFTARNVGKNPSGV